VIFSAVWREAPGGFFLIQLHPPLPDPCQVTWDQLEAHPQPLLAQSLILRMEHFIYTSVATLRPGQSHSAKQTLQLSNTIHISWLPDIPNSDMLQKVLKVLPHQ